MWPILRVPIRKLTVPNVRNSGYAGGVPGNNLPFRKGIESPARFTFFWLILGTIGFGSPYIILRHLMLRGASEPPPEE